jgi:hypothetical protein
MEKYLAVCETIFSDENNVEMYSEIDEKPFNILSEAIDWLEDKSKDLKCYCVVYLNSTSRIVYVKYLP